MLEIRHLSKSFGDIKAIEDISFDLKKGEVLAFLGPNGAGKSTTMKIITGFMPADSGSVCLDGFDIVDHSIEVKAKIGYLPETPPLYLEMTVEDYLSFVAELKRVENVQEQVETVVRHCELQEVRSRKIENLSKGFRQRVGIAQALVSDPELLILDEPTVGLDPKQVAEIRKLIQELAKDRSILLSTHMLTEAQAICQKVVILDKGKIVAKESFEGLNQMLSKGKTLEVKVRNMTDSHIDEIKKLDGFLEISKISDEHYQIRTKDESSHPKVAQILSGANLYEMKTHDLSLEEIFLKLTEVKP